MAKPGRELDALIAEKVMGWTPIPDAPSWSEQWRDKNGYPRRDRPFSTDVAAAWEVVEKLTTKNHISICFYPKLDLNPDGPSYEAHWSVTGPYTYDGSNVQADTAAHAICLAALKAVGVEI